MDDPLVSVAILSYNQRKFLEECVVSCLNQEFSSFEIVVADDCSTDGSQRYLRSLADKDDRVRVLLQTSNKGITANSNDLISLCRGKYIAFMGGDDLMFSGKLSIQSSFMEKDESCVISYHNLEVFDSSRTNVLGSFNSESPPEGGISVAIREGCFNGGSSTMVRASAIPITGFDERISSASDWLFWIDCLSSGGYMKFINQTLGGYRRHGGNITAAKLGLGHSFGVTDFDQLVSCQILLQKYPHHRREIFFRFTTVLWGIFGTRFMVVSAWSLLFDIAKRLFRLIGQRLWNSNHGNSG